MRHKVGTRKKKAVSGVKRVTHKRKRRVSGFGSGNVEKQLITSATVGLGTIVGRELNTLVKGFFPSFTPMVSGAVQTGMGLLLPMLVKNNDIVKNIGLGMSAYGILNIVVSTGLIQGISDDTTGNRMISYQVRGGVNGIKYIAGPGSLGYDDDFAMTAGFNEQSTGQNCVY